MADTDTTYIKILEYCKDLDPKPIYCEVPEFPKKPNYGSLVTTTIIPSTAGLGSSTTT